MFEVGFCELLMVGLVGLVVIGPEKLPAIARLAGFWLGKSRCSIAVVKAEIHRELLIEDLRQHFAAAELQRKLDDSKAAVMDIDAAMEALVDPLAGHEPDGAAPSSFSEIHAHSPARALPYAINACAILIISFQRRAWKPVSYRPRTGFGRRWRNQMVSFRFA